MTSPPVITKVLRTADDWPVWIEQVKACTQSLEWRDYFTTSEGGELGFKTPAPPTLPVITDGGAPDGESNSRLLGRQRLLEWSYDRECAKHETSRRQYEDFILVVRDSIDHTSFDRATFDASRERGFGELIADLKAHLKVGDIAMKLTFEDIWRALMAQSLNEMPAREWGDKIVEAHRLLEEWGSAAVSGWKPYLGIVDNVNEYYPHVAAPIYLRLFDMQEEQGRIAGVGGGGFEKFVRLTVAMISRLAQKNTAETPSSAHESHTVPAPKSQRRASQADRPGKPPPGYPEQINPAHAQGGPTKHTNGQPDKQVNGQSNKQVNGQSNMEWWSTEANGQANGKANNIASGQAYVLGFTAEPPKPQTPEVRSKPASDSTYRPPREKTPYPEVPAREDSTPQTLTQATKARQRKNTVSETLQPKTPNVREKANSTPNVVAGKDSGIQTPGTHRPGTPTTGHTNREHKSQDVSSIKLKQESPEARDLFDTQETLRVKGRAQKQPPLPTKPKSTTEEPPRRDTSSETLKRKDQGEHEKHEMTPEHLRKGFREDYPVKPRTKEYPETMCYVCLNSSHTTEVCTLLLRYKKFGPSTQKISSDATKERCRLWLRNERASALEDHCHVCLEGRHLTKNCRELNMFRRFGWDTRGISEKAKQRCEDWLGNEEAENGASLGQYQVSRGY